LKAYLHDSEIHNLAVYFRRIGFSSYKKERDNIKERTAIFNDKYFEVTFVLRTPYHEGTHLEFAGESANQLYFYIKNNKFNWNQLEQYGAFLRRIDTTFIDCTFENLYLASSRFRDCDLESNNFINLKWDPQNPVIVSNSKTCIRVTDSESFQASIKFP
jgi:hypothetical protein